MGIRSRDLRSTQPNTTEQIIMKAAIFFLAAAELFASPVLAQTNFTSVAAAAAGTPTLSVLLQAVNASGLTSTLSNTSLVSTVFAPSDSAFRAYLTANNLTAAQLLASPALGNILKFHVVPGVAARAANLTDGQVVPTLLGPTLTLNLAGGNVTVRSSGQPREPPSQPLMSLPARASCMSSTQSSSPRPLAPPLPLAPAACPPSDKNAYRSILE